MNIKVTGCSGFIGQHLLNYFKKVDEINLLPCKRSEYTNIDFFQINGVIHLAGIAHDLQNSNNHNQYYEINFELTKHVFTQFLKSEASIFIFVSSIKAACDSSFELIEETSKTLPTSEYGRSKKMAEEFILSQEIPSSKKVFILRPSLIYGENYKGNLDLLIRYIAKGNPWPLGKFNNKRSFCSITNFSFVIEKILIGKVSASGIYNVSDSESLSTNELVKIISKSLSVNTKIYYIPKLIIKSTALLGDFLPLPLNSNRLNKLTETFIVSNKKITDSLGEQLPIKTDSGIRDLINSV